ncbi:SGNH/GDSL hydrolase family protein [Aquihabitans daechungensis]|uniref:SGNH/GDSL hydrolase family protein n=1 Tax=Aquihabitans daechungensis TaxID=1052257 RepID=UPI003BA00DD1
MTPRTSARARRAAAFAVVAILAGATASCGLLDPDPGDRVLIVGDSVTYQSRAELKKDFEWADELDIRATSGLRTDELLPDAEEGVSHDPSSAAFMPGYNDVLKSYVDKARLPEMMELAAEVPCSVWLLIPTRGVYSQQMAEAWNARVRQEAEKHDNVHVVDDWANLVDNSPGYTLVKEEDAVHPNLKGRAAIARVMSDSIKRECG